MTHDDIAVTIIDPTKSACDKYGHHYGSEILHLYPEHIEALRQGKMLALWVNGGEYTMFIETDEASGG